MSSPPYEKSLNWYQDEALRTASRGEYPDFVSNKGQREFDVMIQALGLAGEAGEVADLIKKELGHGHPLAVEKVAKELGDVLWYLAVLAHAYGLTLEDVARRNVIKLRMRYPQGFTQNDSINRRSDG